MSSDPVEPTTTVDFSHLPDISFVNMDTSNMLESTVALFEYCAGRTIFPADHMMPYLTALSAKTTQLAALINHTGQQNLLRYADETALPHLGAMLDVRQLGASNAGTTMRIEVQGARDYAIPFPAGTRFTQKGKQIYFAMTEADVLAPGETVLEVPVKAVMPGTAANGFVPGQIDSLVDPIDGVVKVANITKTSGGAEIEDLESYRGRIFLAPERFSCAGPELAYKFHALSARPGLADVEVLSPLPGVAMVVLLLAGGQIPDADGEEIRDVIAALNAEKIRPLTDNVLVVPAVGVDLDYQVRYYLTRAQAAAVSILDGNIKNAVAAYESWQAGKIGRDINPDHLVTACRSAQAKRIVPELVLARDADGNATQTAPFTFTPVAGNQVARIPAVANRVIFGGLEDE